VSGIYGYARVSSNEQAIEYDALNQQIKRLRDAGAQEVLIDIESGRSDKRKNFNELIKFVKAGKVREVIITRIDRLGRSVITIARTVELFNEHDVKIRVLDAPVDSTSSFGWFSIHQMAGLAEFESRLLSERTRHGMNYFREQLKLQLAPFGYVLVEGKLVVDEPKRQICREIIKLLLDGCSYNHVSEYLLSKYGVKFSSSGIRHWVDNPGILGHTRYFTEMEHRRNPKNPRSPLIYRDTHEAIATDAEITEIKRLAKQGGRKRHPRDKTYPLKGQLRCAECGGGMHRTIYKFKREEGRETHYIRCNKHFRNKLECSNKTNVRLNGVISQVIDGLIARAGQLLAETSCIESEKSESDMLIELRNQLAGLEALGNNPAILAAIQDVKNQILVEKNRQQYPPRIDGDSHKLLDSYRQATFWGSLSDDELASVLKSLVSNVSVDPNSSITSIDWLF
jgi:DNA invertase Pin-like site-specific DNA recombinase